MQTTGIYIEHNTKGVPTFARIDLEKYGTQLSDFFKSNGVTVEKSLYDPEFVEKIKSQEALPSKKLDLTRYGISI